MAALEALQIYAPMGHALGMGQLTAQLEDCCFQVRPRGFERGWGSRQATGRAGAAALPLVFHRKEGMAQAAGWGSAGAAAGSAGTLCFGS